MQLCQGGLPAVMDNGKVDVTGLGDCRAFNRGAERKLPPGRRVPAPTDPVLRA